LKDGQPAVFFLANSAATASRLLFGLLLFISAGLFLPQHNPPPGFRGRVNAHELKEGRALGAKAPTAKAKILKDCRIPIKREGGPPLPLFVQADLVA
jgi:hypothetical protein